VGAHRLAIRSLAFTLTLAVIGAGASACAKRKDEPQARATTTAAPESVALKVLPGPGTPPLVAIAIQNMLRKYLADAIVAPLQSGAPAPNLDGLFTPDTAVRIRGFDRPALVSEGLPAARDGVIVSVATAGLTPLLMDGRVPLVAAAIDLQLRARDVEGAKVDVSHKGDLVLVPIGASWRIGGYDVVAVRATPKKTTTTTAVKRVTP
jgi:hypothetical protein